MPLMFFLRRRILQPLAMSMALWSGLAGAAPAAPSSGLLTILDGSAFLLRETGKFALAEGVMLRPDDVIEVPAGARLARIELPDGLSLALGPGSRALISPRLPGERAGACLYLLNGWLKLSAPKGVKATVAASPLDVSTTGGTLILWVQPDGARVFAEAGESGVRRGGAPASVQTLASGELLSLGNGVDAKAELSNRPTQTFVSALPRAFVDALPARAAKFQDHPLEPKLLAPLAYADAQPWLDVDSPSLRRAYLARWRPLTKDAEFRRGLVADMKAHPEWEPVLFPPRPKHTAP
ncbi:hypothetical protein [Variovorax ginsengisoli]|uniref:FecR protein domain-containing protein n=1 Tax=Variovorax ginsengisoli TaxID=363844 RepID=A0ABT9SAT6_9BURK|nr:hypothetical protein [Variovorax ginsengisoli]MDP9901024.1 hypothetical protein [Variovorax ginsengisoli]